MNRVDLAAYHRDGYALLGKVLSDDEVAGLIREAERFGAEQNAWDGDRPRRLVVQTQLTHRSALIRRIATTGPQIDAVRAIMGDNICLTHQQFVTKSRRAPNTEQTSEQTPKHAPEIDVAWHQDNGYGTLDLNTDITVWFPLADCDATTGCLWVIPGSHLGPLAEHYNLGGLRAMQVDVPGIPVPMRAGEAIAFSGLLVHCSKANQGARRHAFYVRYCEPHARMLSEGGKPVLADGFSWMVSGEAPA